MLDYRFTHLLRVLDFINFFSNTPGSVYILEYFINVAAEI